MDFPWNGVQRTENTFSIPSYVVAFSFVFSLPSILSFSLSIYYGPYLYLYLDLVWRAMLYMILAITEVSFMRACVWRSCRRLTWGKYSWKGQGSMSEYSDEV